MWGPGGVTIVGLSQQRIDGPVHVVGVVQQQVRSRLQRHVLDVEHLAVG